MFLGKGTLKFTKNKIKINKQSLCFVSVWFFYHSLIYCISIGWNLRLWN